MGITVSFLVSPFLFPTLLISHLLSLALLFLAFLYTSFSVLSLLSLFTPICYASRKSVFWISCVSTTVRPTHHVLTKYYSSSFFFPPPSVASCYFSPLSPPLCCAGTLYIYSSCIGCFCFHFFLALCCHLVPVVDLFLFPVCRYWFFLTLNGYRLQ